ncbi:Ribonucleases P/MRP protein subunit pop1 [Conoideocrella luteorostrata]|uniref:Ribonucleases P/MRP protein subunit pop1 n=1 Tax=Conoideocrella luteorostrata TaxID=1105319 RepID=A0AAJ0CXJ2_9HYPO|nr:Ribonucleases P/MRP protein subunit pop1 [Conoideocrella luteorostrata]
MGPKSASSGSSFPASGKRNAAPGGTNGGAGARGDAARQKRAKVFAARNIPAQPADAALKDGEIDLQAFLKAHEFEINAMEQSMATSKAVGASRAFQQVPRGLRRRTASHNPKRVPRRLRSRARKEMREDNTPLVEARRRKPRTTRARIRAETAKRLGLLAARKRRKSLKKKEETAGGEGAEASADVHSAARRQPRPKIRRNLFNDPPKPHARFRRRQISKTWLPTHKWHAKRARMTSPKNPLWRFAMPLTPNEKIYRATHRAQGERGTLVWDTSYMSTIGLYGSPSGIERILKTMGVTQETCWNDRGRKWRVGSRTWTGCLSRQRDGQTRPICPATIIWNPEITLSTDEASTTSNKRQLYIRLCPAAFLETFTELVRLSKIKGSGVYVEDLRFEIGSIELTGPASTETLLSTMVPYNTKYRPKNKHASIFESLKTVTNPSSLPANAALGFSIQDPRLRHPPRKMEFPTDAETVSEVMELLAKWPAEDQLQPYGLFDRNTRFQATCLPSQKAIYKRRSLAAPGSFLKPSRQTDPPIPVILTATRAPGSLLSQGTWNLLMPWKCIPSLWYSIVHCPLVSGGNPRFGGLNQNMQVSFERGVPWFPRDFMATDAGVEWELEERKRRQQDHDKRPKSKRTEFTTVDLGAGRKGEVGDGLACDFELLFGLARPQKATEVEELVQADDSIDTDAMENEQPAVASGKSSSNMPASPPSLQLLNYITKAEFDKMAPPSQSQPPALPPNAIMNIRITLLSGGSVTECARIYRLPATPNHPPVPSNAEVPATMPPPRATPADGLPHDLRAQWLAQAPGRNTSSHKSTGGKEARSTHDRQSRQQQLAKELTGPPEPYPPPPPNQVDIGGHPLVPDADDLIGFVTTGSYCLRDGKGAANGSIAVEKVLPGMKSSREGRLCIVRDAGRQVGRIARWEVV